MRKLRLLFTEDCNRACKNCCNKQRNLDALTKCKSFIGYDEIIITGGEPMLHFDKLCTLLEDISYLESKKILYTAKTDNPAELLNLVMRYLDGLTVTLHTIKDIAPFAVFNHMIADYVRRLKVRHRLAFEDGLPPIPSLRLNVFKQVGLKAHGLSENNLPLWQIKDNMEWIEDCPLPNDEVFMKY